MKKKWTVWKIFGALILFAGLAFLATWIFMLIWNVLMTEIFGLPTISFWQGLGLFALAKFLFSDICGRRGRCKCKGGKKWKKYMKEHCAENSADGETNIETTEG